MFDYDSSPGCNRADLFRSRPAGLPAGLSISPSGLISGTGTKHGTSTITVTGTSASGASTEISFVWTVS